MPYLCVVIVLYFLHSSSVLSFYIDVVLTLPIGIFSKCSFNFRTLHGAFLSITLHFKVAWKSRYACAFIYYFLFRLKESSGWLIKHNFDEFYISSISHRPRSDSSLAWVICRVPMQFCPLLFSADFCHIYPICARCCCLPGANKLVSQVLNVKRRNPIVNALETWLFRLKPFIRYFHAQIIDPEITRAQPWSQCLMSE